ncbi:MAG: N-6 DNA methylase [Gemmatimonadetes bacterium]|nr:N-6 DNA methylase [Gemmatimonadota bacterium]
MAVSPELLSRLKSLDDLLEFVAALGYTPHGDELNSAAQARLGLRGTGLAIRRAAIVGRHGAFLIYGAVLDAAGRSEVALAAERLGRATPGERHLLLVLDTPATTLAVAALAPKNSGFHVRQLRVSLDNPSPVAAEILSGLAPRPRETPLALAVRAADVLGEEGLTSRFFREFARLHARAAQSLQHMPRASSAERRDLALIILTRVLFLYFVQAKGWLAGRRDFLPSLLDTALGRGHSFHHATFETLCFGTLNAPEGARSPAGRALGDVPFLNGGLFERHALERRFPRAVLPNETWRELFDDLFERFHFTAREGDQRDAVDPEMLGRVFEGLMARDRRKSSGAYFTPRELLRETVERALRAALAESAPEAVRSIRVLDPAVGSGAFLLETLAQLEQLRAAHWACESPVERRRSIVRDNLFGVDLDPMAVRLAELRLWLALVVDEDATWRQVAPLPNLDQNLRQGDSPLSPLDLAQVAQLPGAAGRVRAVAERRAAYFAATGREKAALARAIREDERALAAASVDAAITSLGARLLDAAAGTGRDLFGERVRRRPTTARRVALWRRQRRELMAARRRIATEETLPFFAYDVHFGHVMADGGFDLVMGNPPWIRGERLPQSTRAVLARRFDSFRPSSAHPGGFAHLPDLSVAFVERALELARPGGVITLLLPSKLLRAGYAGPLRALLRRRATVLSLDDRAHAESSGFAATVFPMICVLCRRTPDPEAIATVHVAGASGARIAGATRQRDLGLDEAPSRAPWLALPGDLMRAIRSVLRSGPHLRSRFRPQLGVKTGANQVFVREWERADELPVACRVPALLGRDISPFTAHPSAVLLAALDHEGLPAPHVPAEVAEYLRPFSAELTRRADGRGKPLWTLFRTELLRTPWLVIWRDIAPRLEAAPLDRRSSPSPIPLNTCYGVAVPDERTACWLAACLNSGPIRCIAAALAERASGGTFRFSACTVGALPLPTHTETRHGRALALLGREAARGEPWDPNELDRLVVNALGLDADTTALLRHLGDALRRDPRWSR